MHTDFTYSIVFHNKHERHALNKNCNAVEKKLGKTEICVGVNEIKRLSELRCKLQ